MLQTVDRLLAGSAAGKEKDRRTPNAPVGGHNDTSMNSAKASIQP